MLHTDCVPVAVLRMLEQLGEDPAMSGFFLAGGTSLALRFGHRVSVDLDFFTADEFDSGQLADALTPLGGRVVNRAANSLTLELEGVKVDVLRHAYPALGPVEKMGGVRLASVRDVAAMKLNAIVGRGAKKDFYDVVRLLEEFELATLLGFFEEKYPTTERFVVLKSLGWFEDADGEPAVESTQGLSWDEVKGRLTTALAGV